MCERQLSIDLSMVFVAFFFALWGVIFIWPYVCCVAVGASPLVTFLSGRMLVKEAHSLDWSLNLSSDNGDIMVAKNIRLSRLGRQLGLIIVSNGIVMFTSLFGIFITSIYIYASIASIVSLCIYLSASVLMCCSCCSCCSCCCHRTGIKCSTSANRFKCCLLYNIGTAMLTPIVVWTIMDYACYNCDNNVYLLSYICGRHDIDTVLKSKRCLHTAVGIVSTISALGIMLLAIGLFIIIKGKRLFPHDIYTIEPQMSHLELQTIAENCSESLLQDIDSGNNNDNNNNDNSQNENDDTSLKNTSIAVRHQIANVIV